MVRLLKTLHILYLLDMICAKKRLWLLHYYWIFLSCEIATSGIVYISAHSMKYLQLFSEKYAPWAKVKASFSNEKLSIVRSIKCLQKCCSMITSYSSLPQYRIKKAISHLKFRKKRRFLRSRQTHRQTDRH